MSEEKGHCYPRGSPQVEAPAVGISRRAYYDDQEIEAALRVLRSRSLFRYHGVDLQKETEQFEEEFARAVGTRSRHLV